MMRKMRFVLLAMALLLILTACGGQTETGGAPDADENGQPEPSESKVMRLAVVTGEERSLTKGLYHFAEIVEERTNGAIRVEVYPNGELGGDREVLEGLQLGTIEGTTVSTGPVAQFAGRFNVFDLPFLFPSDEIAYEVLDGPLGQELLADLEPQGIIGLNYWENGFRHLTNNVREVNTVDDIRGLNIRTLENDLHIDFWRELGANPTPIAFTELYVALQQGTVDGQENPLGNVTVMNFYEVQRYLTLTGHIYNASPFMISAAFWNTLTEEEQQIMKEAAEEAKVYQRELNKQEEQEALDLLAQEGMFISELTAEEFDLFFERVQPIYEKYASSIGEEFVNSILAEIERLNQ